MPKVVLHTVRCIVPDETDMDEMFLKYNGKKIWPTDASFFRLDVGDVAQVNLAMDLAEGWHEVELWDFDYTSKNDFLGKFRFKVDDRLGKYTNTMTLEEKGSSASYLLSWEIMASH